MVSHKGAQGNGLVILKWFYLRLELNKQNLSEDMQYLRRGLPRPVQLLSNTAKESSKAWEMYPVGSLTTWF